MRIRVSYFGQVKAAVGVPKEDIETDQALTPLALLHALAERHGEEARKFLLDSAGQPQRALLFVLNDEQIRLNEDVSLADGDSVTIMPPISGGK